MSTLTADAKEQNLSWYTTGKGLKVAYYRKKVNGRDRWLSLGELSPEDARSTVRRMRKDTNLEDIERRLGFAAKRSEASTFEDLFKAYKAYVAGIEIDEASVKKNQQCVELILRRVNGEGFEVAPARVNLFSVELLRDYSAKVIEARKSEAKEKKWDQEMAKEKMASAQRTIRSTVRQARSLFSREAMGSRAYAELCLPDMREVLELVIGESSIVAYQRPPEAVLAKIREDAPKLKDTAPAMWLAFNLEVNMGLRRSSGKEAKWEWFVDRGLDTEGAPWVEIEVRVAKGGESFVRVDHALYQEMLKFKKEGQTYIIPGENSTQRDEVFSELVAWLRARGLGNRMPNHELRKWSIDSTVSAHGMTEGQFKAGHSDSKLTSKVYATKRAMKSLRVV